MSKLAMLKKLILRVSVVLLPVSVGFTVVALTLMMLGDFHFPRFLLPVVLLVCGSFLWFSGFHLKNLSRFFFAATFLLLSGMFLLFVDLRLFPFSRRLLWPLLMLFVGFSFAVSGFYRFRKPHAKFMVPFFAFLVLGIIFLIFSTKLVHISLVTASLWWFPLILVPFLVSFGIWLFQRKYSSGNPDD